MNALNATNRNLGHRAFLIGIGVAVILSARADAGSGIYARVGYRAVLSTLAHSVSGAVTIVDEDTIRIDDFVYDGGGISVFVTLGEADTYQAFASDFALQVGPELLGTPHSGDSLVIDLPAGQTLDGYNAVSIWCVTASANFGSGAFEPPTYPRAGYSTLLAPGLHDTSGIATVVDERTIRLDDFSYDGLAPAVFAYLGVTNSYVAFRSGLPMEPQLTRKYSHESLLVQLPQGQSLSGYEALSIWCSDLSINFTSGSFPRAALDLDVDGDIDGDDARDSYSCLSGPAVGHSGGLVCGDADYNGDSDVDLADVAVLHARVSGGGIRAAPD